MNYFIDTDNGLGSWHGDVDDGWAIALLLRHCPNIIGIGSVFGNVSAKQAFRNTRDLAAICGYSGNIFLGATRRLPLPGATSKNEVSAFLCAQTSPFTIIALGPLTNIALTINQGIPFCDSILCVGGNSKSFGLIPPWWPHEFNLTKDRTSTTLVFNSGIPITLLPLNIAKSYRLDTAGLWATQPNELSRYLTQHSLRWSVRNILLKGTLSFPVWDALLALYVLKPEYFSVHRQPLFIEGLKRIYRAPKAELRHLEVLKEVPPLLSFI